MVQGVNYLLPLITIPYLIRVIGVEKFGLLAFVTVVIAYFQTLIDYGFHLSATKQVALYYSNKKKLKEIFSTVIIIQILLMLISAIVLFAVTLCFEKIAPYSSIYWFTFIGLLGQILFPVWFFQGMEQMKYITILHGISKLFFTAMIFCFVKQEADFYLVPILNSVGLLIAGVCAFFLIHKKFSVSFEWQKPYIVMIYLKDGWHIFISKIFVSLYMNINVLILGIFTNNIVVGYYAIADKVISAINSLFVPIQQTIYPHLATLWKCSHKNFFDFVRYISYIYVGISVFLFSGVTYFNQEILTLISGTFDPNVAVVYFILSLSIFTSPFGPLMSQSLIIIDKIKYFYVVVQRTFYVTLLITPIFVYYFDAAGLATAVLLIQLFHIGYLLYMVYMRNDTL